MLGIIENRRTDKFWICADTNTYKWFTKFEKKNVLIVLLISRTILYTTPKCIVCISISVLVVYLNTNQTKRFKFLAKHYWEIEWFDVICIFVHITSNQINIYFSIGHFASIKFTRHSYYIFDLIVMGGGEGWLICFPCIVFLINMKNSWFSYNFYRFLVYLLVTRWNMTNNSLLRIVFY